MKCLLIADESNSKLTTLYILFKKIYPKYTFYVHRIAEPFTYLKPNVLCIDNDNNPLLEINSYKIKELKHKLKTVDAVYVITEYTNTGELIAQQVKEVVPEYVAFFRLHLKGLNKVFLKRALNAGNQEINTNYVGSYMFEKTAHNILNFKVKNLLTSYSLPSNISYNDSLLLKFICDNERGIRSTKGKQKFGIKLHLNNGLVLESVYSDSKEEAKVVKNEIMQAIKKEPKVTKQKIIKNPENFATTLEILKYFNNKISVVEVFRYLTLLYTDGYITTPSLSSTLIVPSKYLTKIQEHPVWEKYELGENEVVPINNPVIPMVLEYPELLNGDECKAIYSYIYKRALATCGKPATVSQTTVSYGSAYIVFEEVVDPGFMQIFGIKKSKISSNYSVKSIECGTKYVADKDFKRLKDIDIINMFPTNSALTSLDFLETQEHIRISEYSKYIHPSYQAESILLSLTGCLPSLYTTDHVQLIQDKVDNLKEGKDTFTNSKSFFKTLTEVPNSYPEWLNTKYVCPTCNKPTRIVADKKSGRLVFKCENDHLFGLKLTDTAIEPCNIYKKVRYCTKCNKYVAVSVKVMNSRMVNCSVCNNVFEFGGYNG